MREDRIVNADLIQSASYLDVVVPTRQHLFDMLARMHERIQHRERVLQKQRDLPPPDSSKVPPTHLK
jgi:hypothetical protein